MGTLRRMVLLYRRGSMRGYPQNGLSAANGLPCERCRTSRVRATFCGVEICVVVCIVTLLSLPESGRVGGCHSVTGERQGTCVRPA